jgi:DNA ligase (NAD+)
MTSKTSSSEFFSKLQSLSREELVSIDGIGEVLADNIINFFQSENYSLLVKKFYNLTTPLEILVNDFSSVGDKGVVCITGTFDLPRPELSQLLQLKGYQVVTAVTKKTTLLLAGLDPGSKVEKATKMKIKIINNYKELLS